MDFLSYLDIFSTKYHIGVIGLWLGIIWVTVVFCKFVYQKLNPQKKPSAINDTFAKKEAELWIEFREKFYDLTSTFLIFIESLSDRELCTYTYNIEKEIRETKDKFKYLILLKEKLKPYYYNSKIDYDRFDNILNSIANFYSTLISALDNPIVSNSCEIKHNILLKGDSQIPRDSLANIKEFFIWTTNRCFSNNKIELEKKDFKNTKTMTPIIKTALDLFKQEINQINEALNEKVTAHLKK